MGMEKASSPLGLTSVPEHDVHCPPGVTFRCKYPSIGISEQFMGKIDQAETCWEAQRQLGEGCEERYDRDEGRSAEL